MAPLKKLYPRSTLRRFIKSHNKCNLSKNADILVRLSLSLAFTLSLSLYIHLRLSPMFTPQQPIIMNQTYPAINSSIHVMH